MDSHLTEVRKFFNRTENYLHKRFGIELRQDIIQEFSIRANCFDEELLDIGCGDGSLSLPNLPSLKKLVLVDVSEAMLDKAGKNAMALYGPDQFGKITFRCADFTTFETTESFKAVLCVGVLAHISDWERICSAIGRITRKDSIVFIQLSTWYHPLILWSLASSRRGYKVNRLTKKSVVQNFRGAGFDLVFSKKYLLPFPGMSYFTDSVLYRIQKALAANRAFSWLCSDYMLVFKKNN